MNRSRDIGMIIIMVFIVGVLSYLGSNALISNKKALTTQVEVVDKISGDFDYLDKPYFENNPLNPTKDITINQNENTKPLGQ